MLGYISIYENGVYLPDYDPLHIVPKDTINSDIQSDYKEVIAQSQGSVFITGKDAVSLAIKLNLIKELSILVVKGSPDGDVIPLPKALLPNRIEADSVLIKWKPSYNPNYKKEIQNAI